MPSYPDDVISKYIRRTGRKFTVYSHEGKPMGTYDTKEEARKRLRQIEMFKHLKKRELRKHAKHDQSSHGRRGSGIPSGDGEFETDDGYAVEHPRRGEWFLTYPGRRTPDDVYSTRKDAVDAIKRHRKIQIDVEKHLQGQHEQKSHGRKGSGGAQLPETQGRVATGGIERPDTKGTGAEGTRENPIKTKDVMEALDLLKQGKHVQLRQKSEVSTLLSELKRQVDDVRRRQKAGEKVDDIKINLCNVSVPGTNLFCAENKDKTRLEMPQLRGIPQEGSRAASMPKNEFNEVDLTAEFLKHLESKGVKVTSESMPAANMKATQNELQGRKVADMVATLEEGTDKKRIATIRDEPLLVSSYGDYVVDGHHRWAANVGFDFVDGQEGDLVMDVKRIDMDILEILEEANDFTTEWGIPPAGVEENPSERKEKKQARWKPPCLGCEESVLKYDEDRRLVMGWAYNAINPDGSIRLDKQQDFIDDPDELEDLAYDFVLESRSGDVMHMEVGVSDLVESMVFTPEKLAKMGLPSDSIPTAWWVGFKVNDPEVWKLVKDGHLKAFSIGGVGVREAVSDDEWETLRKSPPRP